MGISPIDNNLYKNAQYQYQAGVYPRMQGVAKPPQGTTGTAGFQARETGFNWRNLDKYDTKLTGVQQQPAIAAAPSVEEAQFNPFANAKPVSEVAPAATIAQGGNQQLQSKLAGLGTGELTPDVNSAQLRHVAWA